VHGIYNLSLLDGNIHRRTQQKWGDEEKNIRETVENCHNNSHQHVSSLRCRTSSLSKAVDIGVDIRIRCRCTRNRNRASVEPIDKTGWDNAYVSGMLEPSGRCESVHQMRKHHGFTKPENRPSEDCESLKSLRGSLALWNVNFLQDSYHHPHFRQGSCINVPDMMPERLCNSYFHTSQRNCTNLWILLTRYW